MSNIHASDDWQVVVAWNNKPSVVKNRKILATLDVTPLAQRCNSGLWAKYHKLSVSTRDHVYVIDKTRQLVRFSWLDIKRGLYQDSKVVSGSVADFVAVDDRLLVLTNDGTILDIKGHTVLKSTILTPLKVKKWTCLQSAHGRVLAMASEDINKGIIVAVDSNLAAIDSEVRLPLTSNGHSDAKGGSELMFGEVALRKGDTAVVLVGERDGMVHVLSVSKKGILVVIKSCLMPPSDVQGEDRVIMAVTRSKLDGVILFGGYGWIRTLKVSTN